MLDLILSQLANGVALGFIYVLIAIGLSIIFGLLGIVNFAHGVFFTLGAYLALSLQRRFGWPAVILAPFGVAAVGMVVEVTLIRRLYGKDPLFGLIMTFALALLIEAVIRLLWGSGGQPFSPPVFLKGFVEFGPVLLTRYRVGVIGATCVLLLLLWMFLRFTPYGRILRAGSRDPGMVGLLGINLRRVLTGVFGLGTGLAGAAGLMAAPLWSVAPSMSTRRSCRPSSR